jgi:hypothetical protein
MRVRVIESVFPAKLIDFLAPALHAGLSLCRERNFSRSTECLREPRQHREIRVKSHEELLASAPRQRVARGRRA